MPEWAPRSPNRGCLWIALLPLAGLLTAAALVADAVLSSI